jgi:hypothetical protein
VSTFKDAKNREWTIDIDPIGVSDVHKELGVSLYTILDNGLKPLGELLENTPVFLNVVYILVREQCQAKQVDDREFLRGLKGDAMEAMCDAFYEALASFFPKKKRELLMELKAESNLQMDQLFDKGRSKAMTILKNKFGELSESLDSIPESSV